MNQAIVLVAVIALCEINNNRYVSQVVTMEHAIIPVIISIQTFLTVQHLKRMMILMI